MDHRPKFAALTAICGTAAYAIGSAWSPPTPASRDQPHRASQVATTVKPLDLRAGFTPIQRVLMSHIVFQAEEAREGIADETVLERVVVAQNYLLMLMQSPSQQANMRRNIRFEGHRPDLWDRILRAPSRVRAILRVTPGQQAKFARWNAEHRIVRPIRSSQAAAATKTRAQHRAARRAHLAQQRAFVRSILTPAQRAEWDAMLKTVAAEYRAALRG
jgi:hypothetical protein